MAFPGKLGDLMKQAQKMQAEMTKAQEEIAQLVVTGQAGATPSIVKIEMTGRHEAKRVRIDPSLVGEDVNSENLAVLEDLVAAAINDAVHKVTTRSQEHLKKITANMPENFNLPLGEDDNK